MRESVFRFKQFAVKNCLSAMKVGTDGVLLGAWADAGARKVHILDVGAGTGLISLMMAQRNPQATVKGIEIDKNAYTEALENIINSPWNDRISVINDNFLQFSTVEKFDIIVSNPPFFTNGLLAPDVARATARHAQNLDICSFLAKAIELLKENGKIIFIYPYSDLELIRHAIAESNLYINKLCYIYPRKDLHCKRILCECSRIETEIREDSLSIESGRHIYTPEYIELTRDFYLKM